ncbi:B12-binding domain-containing radical SAM protein [Alkalicella caledoniensis]|uniref:B12-binding domain-containing radical SAM protein n=1 Tax=Alkalicella caledoniensis TaxID=2731377 RepID=A0A7G9W505_ALKCA|nr:radical SAM protein [Alkalicella caledoniensis]QNO13767.1 B12-binding domain-containing radical SAM protein [Alkalicella caledoniensis]
MEKYDMLLVNPYWSKLQGGLEHLGLGYIAAELRSRDMKVKIIDIPINKWNEKKALDELAKISTQLIGISLPFQEGAKEGLDFTKKLRKAGYTGHITIGGIYPTFAYEKILAAYPEVNTVVLGEGEITIAELCEHINFQKPAELNEIKGLAYRVNGKTIKTEIRPLVETLDTLAFPSRDTLEEVIKEHDFVSMMTSRGCYGRCGFCSVDPFYSQFGPKYRLRSSENVIKEMEYLHYSYGTRNFMFNDANFIGGKGKGQQRAKEIAEEIINREWNIEFRIQCRVNDVDKELFALLKKAGLSRVYLGVESGSQTVLDRFKKDVSVEDNLKAVKILSELGIFISMGFIMFDYQLTVNELNENISFLQEVKKIVPKGKLGYVHPLTKLMPLAGTEVEKYMLENNKYKGESLDEPYSFDDGVVNFLYSTASLGAKLIWKAKDLLKHRSEENLEWTKGWTEKA